MLVDILKLLGNIVVTGDSRYPLPLLLVAICYLALSVMYSLYPQVNGLTGTPE